MISNKKATNFYLLRFGVKTYEYFDQFISDGVFLNNDTNRMADNTYVGTGNTEFIAFNEALNLAKIAGWDLNDVMHELSVESVKMDDKTEISCRKQKFIVGLRLVKNN